ncbi:hypothetical protein B0H19DRAFT_473118 [Mycena capillaripes]|nr:hypothetical protein B0H19DRAFT_473118 [Mycena capillaripes]
MDSFTLLFGSPGLTSVENQVKGLIAAAEANIERLTAQIRELNCMRDRERSILATLRLMIVPIGKLPTELLVEIFKIAVQTHILCDPSMVHYSRGNLLQGTSSIALRKVLCLSQVSPYWRQIVHNAPQLWTEGSIDIRLGRELTDPYLSRLKTLIARSATYPISVSLAESPKTSKNRASFSESSNRIAAIMVPTVNRWKNLDIDLASFHHFNGLPPSSFEALEMLHIYNFSNQSSPVTVFQTSHRLQNFTLKTRGDTKIHLIHLPWYQLTHLHVEDDSLGGCRTVLLQCKNLISARFNTSEEWDLAPEVVETPTVVLPFLQTLTMIFHRAPPRPSQVDDDLGAFFMPLSLPSLTKISFEFDPNADEIWPTEVFSEFQIRSPNIEEISLLFSSIEPDGLVGLLRHGTSLRKLEIENSWHCLDDDVFDALRYDITDPAPAAPKLQDIYLFCVGDYNLDPLEAAIRSRWWKDGEGALSDGSPPRVSRLKRVSVSSNDYIVMTEDLKAQMQDLILQGLDLCVAWRDPELE